MRVMSIILFYFYSLWFETEDLVFECFEIGNHHQGIHRESIQNDRHQSSKVKFKTGFRVPPSKLIKNHRLYSILKALVNIILILFKYFHRVMNAAVFP